MNKTYRYCNICKGGKYPHGPGLCDCCIAELPASYYTVIDGWKAEAISKIETIYGGKVEENQLPTLERVVDAVANTYAEWVDRETNRPYMKARTATVAHPAADAPGLDAVGRVETGQENDDE